MGRRSAVKARKRVYVKPFLACDDRLLPRQPGGTSGPSSSWIFCLDPLYPTLFRSPVNTLPYNFVSAQVSAYKITFQTPDGKKTVECPEDKTILVRRSQLVSERGRVCRSPPIACRRTPLTRPVWTCPSRAGRARAPPVPPSWSAARPPARTTRWAAPGESLHPLVPLPPPPPSSSSDPPPPAHAADHAGRQADRRRLHSDLRRLPHRERCSPAARC